MSKEAPACFDSVLVYKNLLLSRLIEEKMLILLRQGKISKWFSGIGQEAISVGCALCLKPDEYILTTHRNLGVFTVRDLPLRRLVAQWQGKASGYTNGRDRSFHFGTKEHSIVGMISHLGAQLCVADGIALADKLKKLKKVTLVFSGDGATNEGDFHEAINLASVWDLPVIFLIENNCYALSTPSSQTYRCKNLADRALGYGIEGHVVDGNDVVAIINGISDIASSIRENPRPVIVECKTFRMRGHEEASGVKYVPSELTETWKERDPIKLFEQYLDDQKLLSPDERIKLKEETKAYIDSEFEIGLEEPEVEANIEKEIADVFAPAVETNTPLFNEAVSRGTSKSIRYLDAIRDAHFEAMRAHKDLIIMGQDIGEYGGVFKVTDGLLAEFGPERVRNTPMSESATTGAALGLSIAGVPSIIEMQFADFASCGFNQIVNNLAKTFYRWGAEVKVVIRMPTGAGTGAGPFHSQSNEAWYHNVPGLKIVYPTFPDDAKGLLLSAIEDPNPVLFFEHKVLYRSLKGEVPDGYYKTEIGKARILKEGSKVAIISYGQAVHWALEWMAQNPEISVTLVDLRSLNPLDFESISQAVEQCGKVIVFHEASLTGGIGAEIAAQIAEKCFRNLDAPVMRCAALDTPIPFSKKLEDQFLPRLKFSKMMEDLLAY